MRQLDIVVAQEETLMDLVRQCKGINQTVLAGSTLTGNYRTYLGACSAGHQTILSQILTDRLHILKGNALDLNSQTRSHCDFAAAIQFSSFCDGTVLLCCDLAVSGDYTAVKTVSCGLIP